ncbi:MAG: hypothetical protein K2N34_00830 [Lachnospiraceae bacterium]|nr:hypothetical protein [Lachnospiraceae bacterium]
MFTVFDADALFGISKNIQFLCPTVIGRNVLQTTNDEEFGTCFKPAEQMAKSLDFKETDLQGKQR